MKVETKKRLEDAGWRIGEGIVTCIIVTLIITSLGILLSVGKKSS